MFKILQNFSNENSCLDYFFNFTKNINQNDKLKATQSYSILLLISMPFLFISCEKDYLFEEEISQELGYNIQIKDGRMFFNTVEELQEVYESVKDKNDKELYNNFNKHFSDGFEPLRPIVTDDNEKEVYENYLTINERIIKDHSNFLQAQGRSAAYNLFDHIDDLEDIVGDDAFALFIDTNGEIQIGNKIYKYTDTGLFIVTDNDYDVLNNYLNEKGISRSLLIPTNEGVIYNFVTVIVPNGGRSQLTDSIEYYRNPIDAPFGIDNGDDNTTIDNTDSGGGGSGGANSNSNNNDLDGLHEFVENLEVCSSQTGLFGNFFGTNEICIDEYENDSRRIKTKAFNYDYLLVYHIGVKVKHQKRGWTGIWRRENTNKVAIGVEMAQFEYDYTPVIYPDNIYLNPLSIKYSYSPLNIQYNVESGIVHFPNGGAPYSFLNQETFINSNVYPRIFWDDLTIELQNYDTLLASAIELGEKQVTSDRLNKIFWTYAYKNAKSQLRSLANDNNLELPKSITLAHNSPNYGKLLVQKSHYDSCSNCSRKSETFDFNGAAQVGVNFNASNGNFYFSAGLGELITPESMKVKMYGAIKRNGSWHGTKLYVGIE